MCEVEKAKFEEREKEREGDMGSRAHSFLQKKTVGQGWGDFGTGTARAVHAQPPGHAHPVYIRALPNVPGGAREISINAALYNAPRDRDHDRSHGYVCPSISLAKHDRGNLAENEAQERSPDVRAVEKASYLVWSPKCSCTGHVRCLNRSHPRAT